MGIDDEDLHASIARHYLLAVLNAGGLQLGPCAFQIDAAKSDVIQIALAGAVVTGTTA